MDDLLRQRIVERLDLRFDCAGRLLPRPSSTARVLIELQTLKDDLWTEMRQLREEVRACHEPNHVGGGVGESLRDVIRAEEIETRRHLKRLFDGLKDEIRVLGDRLPRADAHLGEDESAGTPETAGCRPSSR